MAPKREEEHRARTDPRGEILWQRVTSSIRVLDHRPEVDPVDVADHTIAVLMLRLRKQIESIIPPYGEILLPDEGKDFVNKVIQQIVDSPIWYACHLELRQTARQILADLHKKGGGSDTSAKSTSKMRRTPEEPTFPGEEFRLLQRRYSRAHKEGKRRGYVPLEEMTQDDWRWNLDQLHYEGGAKLAHEHELERWGILFKGFRRRDEDGAVVA